MEKCRQTQGKNMQIMPKLEENKQIIHTGMWGFFLGKSTQKNRERKVNKQNSMKLPSKTKPRCHLWSEEEANLFGQHSYPQNICWKAIQAKPNENLEAERGIPPLQANEG